MVKRYDVVWSNTDEGGDFVSYADYAALAERCERLKMALQGLVRTTYNGDHEGWFPAFELLEEIEKADQ